MDLEVPKPEGQGLENRKLEDP